MPLNDSQVQQFKTEGYTLIKDFFSPDEVKAMQAEVERMKSVGILRNVKTENDGKTQAAAKQNLQLCPMSPHSPLFKALPFSQKVQDAVTRLIGDDVILHLDQIFLKPGLRGSGTNWHQDNAYFKISDPLQGTAMWIAVHDANLANGTMRILPGQMREQLEHSRDPESDHHIRCFPDNELESVAFELPAGSVGFFCYGTPHCTMANNTTADRAGCAFHFLTYEAANSVPGEVQSQFDKERNDRPYLTGSLASHGVNEYGSDMRGSWEAEVANSVNEPIAS